MIDLLIFILILFGTVDETAQTCQEDETVVMVVSEVLPDNGRPPGLDWGIGPRFGRTLCINSDDFGL